MINWLEVEGVRYEGQGYDPLPDGGGFHSQLPGHTLDGLEVADAQGNPLGYLSVDFEWEFGDFTFGFDGGVGLDPDPDVR